MSTELAPKSDSFSRQVVAAGLAIAGLFAAAVFAFAANWAPGAPQGAPSAGNVYPPIYSDQACPTGQLVTGADAMGKFICGTPS